MNKSDSYNNKKKVIIIDSDRRVLNIRPIKIANSLKRGGYEVEFLVWDRTGCHPKIEYFEGYRVNNFKLKPICSRLWGLILGYVIWWIYVCFFLLRNDSYIYQPQNLYNLIPTIPSKIIKRRKIVYDIADFVADSIDWPQLVRKFLFLLDNYCIKLVDGVIIVDAYRIQQIESSNVNNYAIVMNCPTDSVNNFESKLEMRDDFIIYFGGWLSSTRGIKQICKAIEGIDGVKLIIAGFGPEEAYVRQVIKSQSNIEFKGLLSNEESLEWTNSSDVVFAFYDPKIRINQLASPNKLFDAMMCGKPVLANLEALPVADVINKEQCGLLVPYDDIQELRSAIWRLKMNVKARKEMGQNGRMAYEREYNWLEMEGRLLKLYNEVLSS